MNIIIWFFAIPFTVAAREIHRVLAPPPPPRPARLPAPTVNPKFRPQPLTIVEWP